jgi:hypothetical protein
MKIWESTHTFDYPWEKVAYGAWRKYPNPINPAVTGIDVLQRGIDANGVLHTERVLQTTWDIPGWVTSLIGFRNPNYSWERSQVDTRNKVMTLKTTNVDCSSFVDIDEKLQYTPHPDDPSKTLLTQSTEITLFNVPFVDRLEQMMVDTFSANSQKGRTALEWAIENAQREWEDIGRKIDKEVHLLSQMAHGIDKQVNEMAAEVSRGIDTLSKEISSDISKFEHKIETRARSLSQSGNVKLQQLKRCDFCNVVICRCKSTGAPDAHLLT